MTIKIQALLARFSFFAAILLMTPTAFADFAFVHPGLLNSREDLARMKQAVAAKGEPISSGYEVFRANSQSQLDYKMRGPLATVGRNPTVGQSDYDLDANAAYQCAMMWNITGDRAYADKSKAIVNAWSVTLKSITGRDAVLMAGLGPFKMVNAAEILRYSDAGWSQPEIEQTEAHFHEVIYPVIKDFAPFANGNWDTAAIKTMMAIAVFCNDRPMFERALRYYVNGVGDGRLTHYVINESGQCQESGRDQQHTQLGLAHLGDCCEIAWHQGLDLYGYENNRLLKGFEYTAKYNLGEEVPFVETLDQTGKYHHTKISTEGRGRFRAVFEEIYNHYVNRRGLSAPYTQRAVEKIRPEGSGGPGADHVGFGTLLFTRPPFRVTATDTWNAPGAVIADSLPTGNNLTWVASVGARNYSIKRATTNEDFKIIARNIAATTFLDTKVKAGQIYRYVVVAPNSAGESFGSFPVSIGAGLPKPWTSRAVGAVSLSGRVNFDGQVLAVESAGTGVGDTKDEFRWAARPMNGDCTLVARFIPQTGSQLTQFGLMMREGAASDAAHVSLLMGSQSSGQIEAPGWNVRLVNREKSGAGTSVRGVGQVLEPTVTNGRLTGFCWLKLERSGDTFAGSFSTDGQTWMSVGTATVPLQRKLFVGLGVASRIAAVTTVMFDHVAATNSSRKITSNAAQGIESPNGRIAFIASNITVNPWCSVHGSACSPISPAGSTS